LNTPQEQGLPVNNGSKVPNFSDVRGTPAETKQQTEYARYRQSARWRNLALAVRMRAKGKCEICLRWDGEECAHLTYERIFNERLTDVLWVCKRCHRELDDTQRI
jgi:hypothetical protein